LQTRATAIKDVDATRLLDQLFAKSEEELLGMWRALGVSGHPTNPEDDCIDWGVIKFFFRDLTVVLRKNGRSDRCMCECFAQCGECPHVYGVLEASGDDRVLPTELPLAPGGQQGSKRARCLPSSALETQNQASVSQIACIRGSHERNLRRVCCGQDLKTSMGAGRR